MSVGVGYPKRDLGVRMRGDRCGDQRNWTKGSYRKLGKSAVARLERSWARRGRPAAYVRAMVRLVALMRRRLPEPPGFDRQRARADVLQRVQELAGKT
jgi:hypothetical protein